jgi:poly(3-hydroxybutyrate) depolymerase
MIETVHERHGTKRRKVFITGLSAGGAMTAVMLAAYPELFAGGAIIAGLPFGTANSVPQALERMRGQELPDQTRLGELVRSASDFAGPWPTISVWHGTRDPTVAPANGKATIDQWRELHGVSEAPSRVETVGDHTRRVWLDPQGREVIEEYEVAALSHGTPLSTLDPESQEIVGPHMLEAGISSTRLIAHFWGIDGRKGSNSTNLHPKDQSRPDNAKSQMRHSTLPVRHRASTNIAGTIEKALRSAGLLP